MFPVSTRLATVYISSILLSNQIFHVIYKYCVYMLRSINFFHVYVANVTIFFCTCVIFFLYMCYCVYFISVYIDLLFTFDDESVTNNNEAVYIYFCLYQCFLFTFDDESVTNNNEAVYIYF